MKGKEWAKEFSNQNKYGLEDLKRIRDALKVLGNEEISAVSSC